MITSALIQVIFWIGLVGIFIAGYVFLFTLGNAFLMLAIWIFGALFWRVWCEMLILGFRMSDSLADIRRNTMPKA